MLFFADKGFRVISHDRRGHKRSAQVGEATRYVARHGRGRVATLVLIGAVPPSR
ncbi:pimeloyl-ACP methyl ester carboxylesterase [Azospirillum sp. OGB3]|nr:pimeloyl-ACP methyl ester carboxylesterase [Azospirillum sp. OGB3]